MATAKLYMRNSKKSNGTYPIVIAINQKGSTAYISTHVSLLPNQWDSKTQTVIQRPDKRQQNLYLQQRLDAVVSIIHQLILNGGINNKTATEIKDMVVTIETPTKPSVRLLDYMREFAKRNKSKKTQDVYASTISAIERYADNPSMLTFDTINRSWLDGFVEFLTPTNKINSIGIHLRNIRATFNAAMDDNLTDNYPFRKYRIPTAPTPKRSISVEELRTIINADLCPRLTKYRDTFVLIFYLIGINTVDLCDLTADNISNGRLEYVRSKTGHQYSIAVQPEAEALINRLAGKTALLDITERYANPEDFRRRLNRALHEMHPGLTSYYARHTWATIAASLDIPKDTIARALGHGGNTVTDIYIDYDLKKVDEANRKVIDYVLYNKR